MNYFGLTPFLQPANRLGHLNDIFAAFDALPHGTRQQEPHQEKSGYDIEQLSDTDYRIVLAATGFGESDIDIEEHGGRLSVRGEIASPESPPESAASQYLHRGIHAHNFERHFQLDEHVKVRDAELRNGLLYINLTRDIPATEKPRKIGIVKALKDA